MRPEEEAGKGRQAELLRGVVVNGDASELGVDPSGAVLYSPYFGTY